MSESTAVVPLLAAAKLARKYVFDQIYAAGSATRVAVFPVLKS